MIPVLGVPVLNRVDLLGRMLASIDVEVGRIIIVDNSVTGIVSEVDLPPNATVLPMRHNIGVAASWNLIIKASPRARWWCIVNNDIEFASGDLAALVRQVEADRLAFSFLISPSAFGLTTEVLDKIGFFDENFAPAYFEDNDYVRRVLLGGLRSVALPANYSHATSSTLGADRKLMDQNNRTFPVNQDYYREKWGGPVGGERFTTPFDQGGGIGDWSLAPRRLLAQTWVQEGEG